MAGIVVFGGTLEGRKIAEAFQGTKLKVHICVATKYGASLLPQCPNLVIHTGRMNQSEMESFFAAEEVEYCLDATHPYAVEVTKNIYAACENTGLPYIRVFRKEGTLQVLEEQEREIYYKNSMEEAVDFLNHQSGNILITTGSRDLEQYTKIADYENRCYVRVLPAVSVIEKCKSLGLEGKHLIGMQGPFSEEMNYCMLQQVNASWMVTKNSGTTGGYQEKCEAALRAGVKIVVIGRTEEPQSRVMDLWEAVSAIKKHYGIHEKRKVYLIGMGPGDSRLLTEEARQALDASDVLIGAKRILEILPESGEKPSYCSYQKEDIFRFLEEHPQYQTAAILYSGDIGFYSGAKGMKDILTSYEVHPVSGISSAAWFLNKLGVPWHQTCLVSCHGQECHLISKIKKHPYVCAILGEKDTVRKTCGQLMEFGMNEIRVTVGERLTYPKEQWTMGNPLQFLQKEFDSLSIVLFENPKPEKETLGFGIADEEFLRGKVPMTKEEIRILSLSKLQLTKDAVIYDIGAGTGSVSIEMAGKCTEGKVYAIERNPEGISLIKENQKKFQIENMEITAGTAPECLKSLPKPSHVFIGGSGGRLLEIIEAVREKNPEVRFVINAVTLETLSQLETIWNRFPEYQEMEMVQINAAKGKTMGKYHLMSAGNPVWIAGFGGRKGEENER